MILVVGHKNPDSDSICSALVATELLKPGRGRRGHRLAAVRRGLLCHGVLYRPRRRSLGLV